MAKLLGAHHSRVSAEVNTTEDKACARWSVIPRGLHLDHIIYVKNLQWRAEWLILRVTGILKR